MKDNIPILWYDFNNPPEKSGFYEVHLPDNGYTTGDFYRGQEVYFGIESDFPLVKGRIRTIIGIVERIEEDGN